jgi:hypothetical protein
MNVRTFYTSPYFELNSMKDCGVRKVTVLSTMQGISVTFLWYNLVNELEIEARYVTNCVPIEIIR